LPRYYLGLDGGQSSTTALIADEQGRVVGSGHAGPCNHVTGPGAEAKFLDVLGDCLTQACREISSDSTIPEFAAACLGFSGGAEDKAGHSRKLIRSPHLKITHDAEIALTGATAGEPGIVIIAGTGSIAFGRNAAGRTARAGGWGYLFGDEGGAFDLVRRALRAALRFEEGWGPQTNLHSVLLGAAGVQSASDLLHRFYAVTPRNGVAAFAPVVTECAEAGDAVAQSILAESADALSAYVEGVYRILFSASDLVTVAYIGGVFRSARVLRAFAERLRTNIGREAVYPRCSPAAGALLEALRLDGNPSKLTGIPEIKT
jgi:N-acetylglucosamine kinase-like BadF-type ATPase